MGFFDFLPQFKKCFFCIPIKVGCYLIGVSALLDGSGLYCSAYAVECHLDLLSVLLAALTVMSFIFAIVFLIGLCMKKRVLMTIFMWERMVECVLVLVLLIVTGAIGKSEGYRFPIVELIIIILWVLFWVYFVAIVNTYRRSLV